MELCSTENFEQPLHSADQEKQTSGKQTFEWRKYSLQDLLLIFLPFIVLDIIFLTGLIFLLEPRKIYHLYSVLDLKYDSIVALAAFTTLEVVLTVLMAPSYYFVVLIYLSSLQLIFASLEQEADSLRKMRKLSTGRLLTSVKLCKCLQILTNLVNDGLAYLCFLYKCISMTGATIYPVLGFMILEKFPVNAIVFINLGVEIAIGFVIVFDKAFRIPAKMERLKQTIVTATDRLTFKHAQAAI
ncbi:unnamed protein product, partial [Allacma fusca]